MYIFFSSETPDCKIYFSADGTKPNPYIRKVGGKEVTFRYTAPFTLRDGKRTLKAIAVTRSVAFLCNTLFLHKVGKKHAFISLLLLLLLNT